AVRAFVVTCLGRRRIVWGGHPAITPMIWAAADDLEVPYDSSVRLYQSALFEDQYPEINAKFANVTVVPAVRRDEHASLTQMRLAMLQDSSFVGAAFIGGMEGVIEEFRLFREIHADVPVVLVNSTGGATQLLAESFENLGEANRQPFDYYGLFSERLH